MIERIRTVRLYGWLGRAFGREHRLAVASPAEAVRALCALLPGFEKALADSDERGVRFACFAGRRNLAEDELGLPVGDDAIRIAPVLAGAKSGGLFQTILGAVLLAAATYWAEWPRHSRPAPGVSAVAAMGASMMLNGVAQMLSPQQRMLSVGDGRTTALPQLQRPREHHGPGQSRAAAVWRNVRRQRHHLRGHLLGRPSMKQRQRIRKRRPRRLFSRAPPGRPQGRQGRRRQAHARGSARQPAQHGLCSRHRPAGRGRDLRPVHGMDNALRDVYLNGTPVANADGTLNFSGAAIDFRTGTQLQEPLPGFPAAESTIAVGAELKAAQHWTRLFANLQASAIRVTLGVEGLSKANTGNGDINGYRVEYAIDLSVDGAGYQEVLASAFDGKTTQRYMRSHRIELPRAPGLEHPPAPHHANANSNTIADRTFIDSVTEVIDAKLRYPMSAVVGIKINASQFQSIPTRAYHVRGRIIRVPANYDPELRSYSGVWDGTFKLAWTNNPAWVFHDLISNDRYGLGTRVPAGWLDKWGLYQIGRYCDEMVDDGFGGKEPRFTCNVYLQQAADAYRVVQDFASIFRGMAYWANASVFATADMPSDPVYTYSSANVVDGKFSYVGSALGTRYTVALVSWNDLSEMGRQKVEYVENREASRVTASSRSRSRALAAPRAARRTASASGCC